MKRDETAATVPRAIERRLMDEPRDRFALQIIAGADAGTSLVCDASRPARALVGTSGACDLRLRDRLVSRRHLAAEVDGESLRITDLDSTNGTFLGSARIHEVWLRGGEVLAIGESLVRVDRLARTPQSDLSDAVRFGRTLGASTAMRRLYPLCERLAATDLAVVIEGETGTGKDVLAESLHECGPRAKGPFVVFDCAAVPPSLVESALFGHERGAFTGASASRRGVFEEAEGGTLFLDELGELPLDAQPKLLRAIETSEIQRVGANRRVHVDVRIIAGTRRDLDREVQEGRFREDLFYRLAVARIELPPLRRRAGDVILLARHFFRELGGGDAPFPPDLALRLESSQWPGNVRELEHTIARYLALGELELVDAPETPDANDDIVETVLAQELPLVRARERVLEAFERRYIERVLARFGGNVSRAATSSGLARRYFQILRARRAPPRRG